MCDKTTSVHLMTKPKRPIKAKLPDNLPGAVAAGLDFAIQLEAYADDMDEWLTEEVLPVLKASEDMWEGRGANRLNPLKLHHLITQLEDTR